MGTKLLIANLAVFIDIESAPCAKIFLKEKTNIKIDMTNTVTEVKVFLISLDMPPNSIPPSAFIQLNIRHKFTKGSMKATKKPSTIEINKTIEALDIVAEVIFPLIICIVAIIGAKALITLQIISI